MGICNFRFLFIYGVLFVCFMFVFCFFGTRDCRRIVFFQRVYLYKWVIAGHKLGTLSKQIHNSLTVYDNSSALKSDNFSEFQNVISNSPASPNFFMTDCVRKSICDSSFIFLFIYFPHHSHTYNILAIASIIVNVFRNIKSNK